LEEVLVVQDIELGQYTPPKSSPDYRDKFTPQPESFGHQKALLIAPPAKRGRHFGERGTQNVLSPAPVDLQFSGQVHDKVDQSVVKKRMPNLQGMGAGVPKLNRRIWGMCLLDVEIRC
jgi:hypothetical protein